MSCRFPWARPVFADDGYAGKTLPSRLAKVSKSSLEMFKRSATAKEFVLLPQRRVIERTLAWLNRNCRLAMDFTAPRKARRRGPTSSA